MAVSSEYKEFIADQLSGLGEVTVRNMFGGAGVYHAGVMFALIADEVFYLKADATTTPDFEAEGCGPFTYDGKGKPVRMSYWECPERLFDDPDEMETWARVAFEVACKGKKK
ncbi:MAG: TfoX/Sxy family protein [Hyphomicrobiaceae bacterium]